MGGQWRQERWSPPHGRRGRSGTYRAWVPDGIALLDPLLPASTAAIVGAAERAVERLESAADDVPGFAALSVQLLRSEAVASSRIEGLPISARRLARAAVEGAARDFRAGEVLANLAALREGVALGAAADPIDVRALLRIQRLLMEASPTPRIAGLLRDEPVWIGGATPLRAAFVPPPSGEVPRLLDDLCAFLARDDLPPVVQAALAHAQFETIHPFGDGNGRVGRVLVSVVLARRGLATRILPPVSAVLAGHVQAYIDGLVGFREDRLREWCELFAGSVLEAAERTRAFAEQVSRLQDLWREAAGRPRRDSAAEAVIRVLPGQPVTTVTALAAEVGRSFTAVNDAVERLAAAGVLRQVFVARRHRAWEAGAILDLVRLLDEDLADADSG